MKSQKTDPLLPSKEPLSFFQIYIQLATKSQKLLIIFICLVFAMSGSMILGIPIIFKDPKIMCISGAETKDCTEEEACSVNHFFIDMDTGPRSLSAEYELICDNKGQKTFAITMSFVGVFAGCLMATFLLALPQRRKFYLSLLGFLLSFSLIGMIIFQSSFMIISILIGAAGFCFIYINTFAYLFIGENFKGELAGFVTIIYSVTWAITGISYSIFAYLIRADWKIFAGVNGVISFCAGLGLFLVKNEAVYNNEIHDNEENREETMGIFSYFHDMWPNVQIRKNFIIYAVFWSLFTVCYSVILIELESVGGNLYFNMSLCSTIEICAAVLAGTLTKRYNCTSLLRILLTGISIFFTIYIFAPPSLSSGDPSQALFFICCLFLAKINNDSLNLVAYLYLPKAFTDKYVSFWLLCSRFLSRFLSLFIPTISYLMRSFGFHPFCFYGICWICCRIAFNMTKEMQSEGVDDLLNDMKVNMTERLSVMTGSFSNGAIMHDENLKNIQVDGIPLSIIRKFKQDPSTFKQGSQVLGLRDSILKRSKISFGNKQMSMFELKQSFQKK